MFVRGVAAYLLLRSFGAAAPSAGGGQCLPPGAACEDGEEANLLQVARGAEKRSLLSRRGMLPGDPPFTLADLGPLQDLIGTWEGNLGLNIIAVPDTTVPAGRPFSKGFATQIQNYTETLTFEPILGAVGNRGFVGANQATRVQGDAGNLNQFLYGLTYTTVIHSIDAEGKKLELIHEENGQWQFNKVPGIDDGWSVGRMSIVPHGQSFQALGSHESLSGEQVKADQKELATDAYNRTGKYKIYTYQPSVTFFDFPAFPPPAPEGLDTLAEGSGYDDLTENPWERLGQNLGGNLQNMSATVFNVSTDFPGANFVNLPNVDAQVHNRNFNCRFYLESWTDDKGEKKHQLQYAQVSLLFFKNYVVNPFVNVDGKGAAHCKKPSPESPDDVEDCLAEWPHVQLNTLTKVK